MTKIPSRNKQHENHTRWWWQLLIVRICVILFLSYMHSNAFIFLKKQLAHKYLEDNQAVSAWSSNTRWPSFPCSLFPWSGGSGEVWHLPLCCTLSEQPSPCDAVWWWEASLPQIHLLPWPQVPAWLTIDCTQSHTLCWPSPGHEAPCEERQPHDSGGW